MQEVDLHTEEAETHTEEVDSHAGEVNSPFSAYDTAQHRAGAWALQV